MAKKLLKGHKDGDDGKKLTYDLTYKDVVDLLEIIDHSTCRELHLQLEDLNLTVIKKGENLSAKNSQETKDSKKGR